MKIWVREVASLLPVVDVALSPWSEHKRRLFGTVLTWRLYPDSLHIITSDLVFRAITTVYLSVREAHTHHLQRTDHCGKVSSQRICLLLQVLQPFRLFV